LSVTDTIAEVDRPGGVIVRLPALRFTAEGTGSLRKATFALYRDNGQLIVQAGQFLVDPALQRHRIGSQLVASLFELFRDLDVSAVRLGTADVGGYAWARMGALPINTLGWELGPQNTVQRLVRTAVGLGRLTAAEGEQILREFTDDAKSFWALVNGPYGKKVFLDSSWYAVFNTRDADQMLRMRRYFEEVLGAPNPTPNPLARPKAVLGINFAPEALGDFLEPRGREFTPAPLPADVKRGPMGQCYANATRLVMKSHARGDQPPLEYVEGIAYSGRLGQEVGFLHAWAVTADGKVVDPTWPDPQQCRYFGIQYNYDAYLKHIARTRKFGVLGGAASRSSQDKLFELVQQLIRS